MHLAAVPCGLQPDGDFSKTLTNSFVRQRCREFFQRRNPAIADGCCRYHSEPATSSPSSYGDARPCSRPCATYSVYRCGVRKKHLHEKRLECDMVRNLVLLTQNFPQSVARWLNDRVGHTNWNSNSWRLLWLSFRYTNAKMSTNFQDSVRRGNSHASCFNINLSAPQLPPKRTTCMFIPPFPVRHYQKLSRSCTENSCSQHLRLLPVCVSYAMSPSM